MTLARVMETDPDVINWLRPHPHEFNITYNHGHNYEPDFVVETKDVIYLVEVKGEDKLKEYIKTIGLYNNKAKRTNNLNY